MRRQIIAVPMGDPAGVGPEIVVKALSSEALANRVAVLVIGDRGILEDAMRFSHCPLAVHPVEQSSQCLAEEGVLNLLDLHNIDRSEFSNGKVSGKCGAAAYQYIEKAVELAMRGDADAVATPPINKESLRAGGVDYIGHTEIFAGLTGVKDPLTMFEVRGLRVFFLSRHVSLKKAIDLVTKDRIIECTIRCIDSLKRLGVANPSIAIAGLNPHSGEHGLFGDEEGREIEPAVSELRAAGYNISGPVGADSVFHLALHGRYDAVLSLYHDQGHIATKTLDFERTIAVTNGLPFLRTSVDHGTAFDIAGQGIASPVSMIEAILLANKYVPFFRDGYPAGSSES
jgi:4-phospho-D-threonate 3-dehydrogenase / 4-phospho-D-erythronate 3-dehydrogenase